MVDSDALGEVGRALRVALDDGYAEAMGDGMFVLFQEVDGEAQSLVLSEEDLRRMLGMC
ncbi:hypothetical protein [Sphingomonas sp. BK580]|uniref:hypothetical protein n=1 Tax=Sphingomonas sp. BK580 TaxID=2586972 RepID=UPI0016194971|nr:hypothetical protein [Sphingomonas sp. BK580]MBB3693024.1 hypothetical protein [Sphingomonas sp. BK580]